MGDDKRNLWCAWHDVRDGRMTIGLGRGGASLPIGGRGFWGETRAGALEHLMTHIQAYSGFDEHTLCLIDTRLDGLLWRGNPNGDSVSFDIPPPPEPAKPKPAPTPKPKIWYAWAVRRGLQFDVGVSLSGGLFPIDALFAKGSTRENAVAEFEQTSTVAARHPEIVAALRDILRSTDGEGCTTIAARPESGKPKVCTVEIVDEAPKVGDWLAIVRVDSESDDWSVSAMIVKDWPMCVPADALATHGSTLAIAAARLLDASRNLLGEHWAQIRVALTALAKGDA